MRESVYVESRKKHVTEEKIVDYRAGCAAIDLSSLNMSHLHQSVQPISNNDANILQDNMP